MKYSIIIYAILISIASSCGAPKSSGISASTEQKRIAVLPFHSVIKLNDKQREKVTDGEIKDLNAAQGMEVQNAVITYLLSKKLNVRIQGQSVTNSKLKSAGVDLGNIRNVDIIRLSDILGVDAILEGQIETEKPMSDDLARGLNVAKNLAWELGSTVGGLGKVFNTTTNKGACSMSLTEPEFGDQLWAYRGDVKMGEGSDIQDVINDLMKKGAKNFPY